METRTRLTHEQRLQIASLPEIPGFQLLCDSLAAEVDDLTDELERSPEGESIKLLPLWKASRRLLRSLKLRPQIVAEELSDEQNERVVDPETGQVDLEKLARASGGMEALQEVLGIRR